MKTEIIQSIKPEVSVIVPFYNSEKFIIRCLDSIVSGIQIPYEVICVNDGSKDNSLSIVRKYRWHNRHIRIIDLKRNCGLYYARLIGVKKARGRYIGFVDSDDFISKGYFDSLYYEIIKNDSDIAVGKIINVDTYGVRYIQTRCATFPYTDAAENDDIYTRYWKQCGKCYHWHVVWNKLYKKAVWKEQIKVLKQQTKHLVMLEDFIFSSVVLAKVKRYAVAKEAFYYYVSNEEAATNPKGYFEIKKSISDMNLAFEFIRQFLYCSYDMYMECFQEWKQRYGRYWKRNVLKSGLSTEEKENCLAMLKNMTGKEIGDILPDDEYYYEVAEYV